MGGGATRSEGDEQSDFKTTTLRFTNNNFTIEHPGRDFANRFPENGRGQSPYQRPPFDNAHHQHTDINFSQASHIDESQARPDDTEYGALKFNKHCSGGGGGMLGEQTIDDEIEEEISQHQDTPYMNAQTKQMHGNQSKFYQLDAQ